MAKLLFFDSETQTDCDIKAHGSYLYTRANTRWLCISYAFDDEKAGYLTPNDDITLISDHVKQGGIIVGHNFTGFDRWVWEYVIKLPPVPYEQIHDTMAMAYAMSLPGSLDAAAQAVGLEHQKDMKASRVMLQCAKPRANGEFYTPENAPEKYEILYKYAVSDIEATRELYHRLMKITGDERKVFELDLKINNRGIPVDVENIKRALGVVEREQKRLTARIQKASNNEVSTPQAVAQIVEFVKERVPSVEKVTKKAVSDLLSRPDLPKEVREVLEIRQEAAKSSTAKLRKMADTAFTDGRIRGTLQYHGASTGRWAGRGAQFQNFPRGKIDSTFWSDLENGGIEILYASPLDTISKSLRGFVKASNGYRFIGADYSQIEARVLPWLAGQEDSLEVFRSGKDIYKIAAAKIYNVPENAVTDAQRFVGKVAILSLGYGGGKTAFGKMAANYGVEISEDEAEATKLAWREANKQIVNYWYAVEKAAMEAVLEPGKTFLVKQKLPPIKWRKQGSFLWCQLPSKRCLCYPYPEIKKVIAPWGDERDALTFMGVNSVTRQWERQKTYGGSLVENITQAVARDRMATAMLELEAKDYPIILTVHDEVVAEVKNGYGSVKEFVSIMTKDLAWTAGLPIKAEGWESDRYAK